MGTRFIMREERDRERERERERDKEGSDPSSVSMKRGNIFDLGTPILTLSP